MTRPSLSVLIRRDLVAGVLPKTSIAAMRLLIALGRAAALRRCRHLAPGQPEAPR